MANFLKLSDLSAYKKSFHLSNDFWDIAIHWYFFAKDTIGKQYVKSLDSISVNIAEGFGRYTKKDKVKFYRYSLASAKESLDWNEKCKHRNLLTPEQYQYFYASLIELPKEINALIKYTNLKLTK